MCIIIILYGIIIIIILLSYHSPCHHIIYYHIISFHPHCQDDGTAGLLRQLARQGVGKMGLTIQPTSGYISLDESGHV